MNKINKQLQHYVEEKIFPIYENNDLGHGIEHIKYVIKRIFNCDIDFYHERRK